MTADEERAAIVAWLVNGAHYGRYASPEADAIFKVLALHIERLAHHERNGHEGE